MRETSKRRGLTFFVACLLVGLGWFVLDLLFILATDDHAEPLPLARRALRFLPWHIGAFTLLGAGLAAGAPLLRLPASTAIWWALWGATAFFGGGRVFEGALHLGPALQAALEGSLVVAAFGVLLGALALAVSRTSAAVRSRLTPALVVTWSLLAVAWLRRAGPALGLGEIELLDSLAMVQPEDGFAALATGAAVAVLCGARNFGIATALVAAALLPLTARGADRTPDVIVVLVDTLRADHLGAPAELGRHAPEFFRFERAFSPSTRTALSMPGIMTSLTPEVVTQDVLPPEAVTLPERLQEGGWKTFGLSANPRVSAQFGYEQGFDELAGPESIPDLLIVPPLKLLAAALPGPAFDLGLADAELYYPRIPELARRALRILDGHPQPTFLWLQTMDVHGPYLPPKRYLDADYRPEDFLSYYELLRISGTERMQDPRMSQHLENLRQRYAAEVRFTDVELAAFFDALEDRGRWDESIVVILSDHGEAFGEHGFGGHGHEYVGSSVVHVPFWIKPPRSLELSPMELRTPVSTYDLLPTLLGLLGLAPLGESFGTNLVPLMQGSPPTGARTVIAQSRNREAEHYAVVRDAYKLDLRIEEGSGKRSYELWNLETDPGELQDLAAAEPEIVRELVAATDRHRAREQELLFDRSATRVDPAVRQRLEALGYVDD